jgi:hypothetical protein
MLLPFEVDVGQGAAVGTRRVTLALAVTALLVLTGCDDPLPGTPRSTGDPSPAADKQEAAERFAPLVWLSHGEKYEPADTADVIAESELWFHEPCDSGPATRQVAADVDPARLSGRGAEAYTVAGCNDTTRVFSAARDADVGVKDADGFYLDVADSDEVRRGDVGSAPVYWEFYDKGDGHTTAYVYWLFYGYNDFFSGSVRVNAHEGDWERVAVQLDDGEPIGMTYWKHEEPACLVPWDDLEKSDGHPVAYSALGSHGSYHRAGAYDATPTHVGPVPAPDALSVVTDITSPGTKWPTWERATSVVSQPWWNYRGRWGNRSSRAGYDGPRAPFPGRAEPVFSEEPCAEPLPLPTATPGPPPPTESDQIDEAFLGSWRSPEPARQPGSDHTYWVEFTLRAGTTGQRVGDIRYPGLDCTGGLTLVESAPDRLVVTEHIEAQPLTPCTVDGIITMTPNAGGLSIAYARKSDPDSIVMTADLIRV